MNHSAVDRYYLLTKLTDFHTLLSSSNIINKKALGDWNYRPDHTALYSLCFLRLFYVVLTALELTL